MSRRAAAVVLVGTAHSIQTAVGDAGAEFRGFLEVLCRTHSVRAVAEEMSGEALAKCTRAVSIPQELATALMLEHRFCDPDTTERARFGIHQENDIRASVMFEKCSEEDVQSRIREEYEKRERYWLEQLRALAKWPVLFICGANHVKPFQMLLIREQLSVLVAANDWSPSS